MISSKKKVLENYDCDDDNYDNNEKYDDIRNDSNDVFIAAIFMRLTRKIMTKSRIIMTRTVITLMLTTLMILIAVIRIIMNIENDNDEKKIQQATVDNNLALRTLDQLRDLISLF